MIDAPDVTAMLLDIAANAAEDPVARFIRTLSNDPPVYLRRTAEETVQLRREFLLHAERVHAGVDTRDALRSAEWLTRHARDVAYRWGSLSRAVRRWGELQVDAVVVRVGGSR